MEMENSENELLTALEKEISERNNCRVECIKTINTIWLRSDDGETEFRYVIFLHRIIVSRISFSKKRSGCMTACFEILKSFAKELDYSVIVIQSVITYEMMCWCEKFGFMPKEFNIDIEDECGRIVKTGDYQYNLPE